MAETTRDDLIRSGSSPGGGATAGPAGGLVLGADGKARCAWGSGDPLYVDYHDHEWGRPLGDERALFELMCLEAFQSGLSWLLILRKRPGFRDAFHGFDPEVVANYRAVDVERLLSDSRIVRNRAKIEAAIANAAAVVALHEQGETLVELVFSHTPGPDERPSGRFATMSEIPTSTAASRALAKELRARGFRFVGPVVGYSLMEAAGVVDDHLEGCWVGG